MPLPYVLPALHSLYDVIMLSGAINTLLLLLLLLLFTRPLQKDGGMAEDHVALEAEQLPRVWRVQNEMRGVLGRVSTGAAGRILSSANPREIRT